MPEVSINMPRHEVECLVLVVLYGLRLSESETLASLETSLPESCRETYGLVIWNNGPAPLDRADVDAFLERTRWGHVAFEETLQNLPLSRVYNLFIEKASKRFVFFDQDTNVGPEYWQALVGRELDVLTPRIMNGQDCHYPRLHKKIVSTEQDLEMDGLISITSGVAISRALLGDLKKATGQVFDERFALYGVDLSLFVRIQRLARTRPVKAGCYGSLRHSLSELENESSNTRRFRDIEKFYVAILMRLHYKGTSKAKVFRYICRQLLAGRSHLLPFFPSLMRCLITGRHPRCV